MTRDFYHATQNGTQLKSYKLFVFGTFYLIFLGCSWLRVTEAMESKAIDKGGTTVSLFKDEENEAHRLINTETCPRSLGSEWCCWV